MAGEHPPPPHGPPVRNGRGTLRVLVVEDDTDMADITAQLLGLYGFDVRIARDGLCALQIARSAPPDVVLLDLGLPGLDGYEVARRICDPAAPKRPLLVAVSGYGREEDRRRSAEAGMDLHLVKPADPEELVGVLRRFQALLESCEPVRREAV